MFKQYCMYRGKRARTQCVQTHSRLARSCINPTLKLSWTGHVFHVCFLWLLCLAHSFTKEYFQSRILSCLKPYCNTGRNIHATHETYIFIPNSKNTKNSAYYRHVDDILIIYDKRKTNIERALNDFNSIHRSINFIIEKKKL
jgi:hypothetical protein